MVVLQGVGREKGKMRVVSSILYTFKDTLLFGITEAGRSAIVESDIGDTWTAVTALVRGFMYIDKYQWEHKRWGIFNLSGDIWVADRYDWRDYWEDRNGI